MRLRGTKEELCDLPAPQGRAARVLGTALGVVFRLALGLGGTQFATATPSSAQVPGVVACEKCHGNRDFLVGKAPTPEGEEALYVPGSILIDTPHQNLACADCHPGHGGGYPHRATVKVAPCQRCHEREGADWTASIHAANVAAVGDAPTCAGCHNSHVVYGADERRSPTHPLNVAALCGRCHADPRIIGTYFMVPEEAQARVAVTQYHQTVHGVAMTRAGLVVSATCNDCHQAHRVLPVDSPRSSVNRANIAATCGACHAGILEVYEESAHGRASRAGPRIPEQRRAPVCVDCHTSHQIVRADEPAWFIGVVEECGECHDRLYETYFGTYHGKVTRLGFGLTAKCSDCHTSHDIRSASDLQSSVHPLNLIATCAQCHPRANRSFVRYYTHGDPRDRENYPLLFWPWLVITAYVVGAFALFNMHTGLWLGRLAIDRMRRRTLTDNTNDRSGETRQTEGR